MMAGHISKIMSLHRGFHFSYNFILQQFLGARLHIKAGILFTCFKNFTKF